MNRRKIGHPGRRWRSGTLPSANRAAQPAAGPASGWLCALILEAFAVIRMVPAATASVVLSCWAVRAMGCPQFGQLPVVQQTLGRWQIRRPLFPSRDRLAGVRAATGQLA